MINKVDIFVISLASPILVGIYENKKLIKTISKEGKTSEVLPNIIQEVLNIYKIDNIIYVNGPGSYMAIKVAYIFLKTICIVKKINFLSLSGFAVNNNSAIKALGNKYFSLDDKRNIIIRALYEHEKLDDFILPLEININNYSKDTLPNYQLPAVTY